MRGESNPAPREPNDGPLARLGRWCALTRHRHWESIRPPLFCVNQALVQQRHLPTGTQGISAYGVWRAKNSDVVAALIAEMGDQTTFHLHCLDTPMSGNDLSTHTRSWGPGMRVPLLSALISQNPPRAGDWLMIFDDDAAFSPGGGQRFVAVALAAGLDICQPGHGPGSHYSHPMTRARFLSLTRLTAFVEVGPVVLFSPAATARVLPFAADIQMGWGLDVEWALLRREGLRLGIVDASPIQHTGAVGADYSRGEEGAILRGRLEAVNVETLEELIVETGEVWRPWQATPRWLTT